MYAYERVRAGAVSRPVPGGRRRVRAYGGRVRACDNPRGPSRGRVRGLTALPGDSSRPGRVGAGEWACLAAAGVFVCFVVVVVGIAAAAVDVAGPESGSCPVDASSVAPAGAELELSGRSC